MDRKRGKYYFKIACKFLNFWTVKVLNQKKQVGSLYQIFIFLHISDYDHPSCERSNTSHTSDIFSILGTIMLLIYWPSFNGILAFDGEGKHRATFNTYLSLSASTVCTFLLSAFLGRYVFIYY